LERAGSIAGGIDSMTAETAGGMIGTASTAPDSDAAVASAAAAAQASSSDILLGFFFFSDCRDCRD
jgi:hypothetical protein